MRGKGAKDYKRRVSATILQGTLESEANLLFLSGFYDLINLG
jgi:hypothetical protein